jgi:hypothetical protein
MREAVFICCLSFLSLIGWFVYQEVSAQSQRQTLAHVAALAAAIQLADREMASVYTHTDPSAAQIENARKRRAEYRAQLVTIENAIKEANAGALPNWLRNDRAWRAVSTR